MLSAPRLREAEKGDFGMVNDLPYPDAWFDKVVATLVLHQLTREAKASALREVHRLFRPGGRFPAADFGPPQNALMHSLVRVSEPLERRPRMAWRAAFRGCSGAPVWIACRRWDAS